MVVHSFYPDDPRVRRETEALLDDGWAVDVVCLRGEGEKSNDECNGARIYRLPMRRHRGSGFAVYMLEYIAFFLMASIKVLGLHLQHHYHVVQTHNMPDFIVFTALLPKLLGARAVLDIHDLVPELYMSKFQSGPNRPVVRIARWLERRSTAFADQVITAGAPFRSRLIERGVPPGKVTVVMNAADPQLFRQDAGMQAAGTMDANTRGVASESFVLMYHGGIFERYGLDIAIRAVDRLRAEIPGIQLHIYGQGEATESLARLVKELDLEDHVLLGGFVPIDQIPDLIKHADLGVVPYRQNGFTNLLYPTKAFEYIVMGVPVIMSSIGAVVDLFHDVPDIFFPPEDVEALANHILCLYQDPNRRSKLLQVSRQAYVPYAWENQRATYLALMQRLVPVRNAVPQLKHL